MDPAVATICGAILGATLAGPVSYFFTSRIARRQHENSIVLNRTNEFNRAAASFRSAFTETIRRLEETDSRNPHEIVGQGHVGHWNAVIQFRPYLSATDQARLNDAWSAHQKAYHDHDFNSRDGNRAKVKELANEALESIQTLTGCAVFK